MGKIIKISRKNSEYKEPVVINCDESIICETPKAREIINVTLEAKGWKFQNFSSILEDIGIKQPVTLKESPKNSVPLSLGTLKCLTDDGKEAIIHFSTNFMVEVDPYDISVEIDGITTNYILNYADESKNVRPIVYVTKKDNKTIKGKRMMSSYYEKTFNWHISLGKGIIFRVTLKWEKANTGLRIEEAEKYYMIEDYLLGIKDYTNTLGIYHKISEILDFTMHLGVKEIIIVYEDILNEWDTVRYGVSVQYGTIVQYITSEGNNRYNLKIDGGWECAMDGIRVSYVDYEYEVTMYGDEREVTTINVKEKLKTIKKKIRELYKIMT